MQAVQMSESNPPAVHAGVRKAAILVLVLGTDLAREVFQHLPEAEIRGSRLRQRPQRRDPRRDRGRAPRLRRTMGRRRGAQERRRRLRVPDGARPRRERVQSLLAEGGWTSFQTCAAASADMLAGVLAGEHPQGIAIVLSSLTPDAASEVLGRSDRNSGRHLPPRQPEERAGRRAPRCRHRARL